MEQVGNDIPFNRSSAVNANFCLLKHGYSARGLLVFRRVVEWYTAGGTLRRTWWSFRTKNAGARGEMFECRVMDNNLDKLAHLHAKTTHVATSVTLGCTGVTSAGNGKIRADDMREKIGAMQLHLPPNITPLASVSLVHRAYILAYSLQENVMSSGVLSRFDHGGPQTDTELVPAGRG